MLLIPDENTANHISKYHLHEYVSETQHPFEFSEQSIWDLIRISNKGSLKNNYQIPGAKVL